MSRTVETTKRSSRHKWTEHSDGSSEEYRKTTYEHEKKTETSNNGHSRRRRSLPLPGSGRLPAMDGQSAPHRLGIGAPPPKHRSDRYHAAALRVPSAVPYGGGQRRAAILPNNLYSTPAFREPSIVPYSGGRGGAPLLPNNNYYNAAAVRNPAEMPYGGGPMRMPTPTPFDPAGHVYPSPARATPRNVHFQGGGGGGFRRGLPSLAPSDSASNVPLRGNGHAYNYGGGSVSGLGDRRLPAHLAPPYPNSYRNI